MVNKRNVGAESILLIDGWKNSSQNTKNVATILQTADGTLSFLDSRDLTGVSETGSVLATICEESIALAKERFNTEVFCVVSDNAANMMSMGRQTQLFHSTCSSHTANLLAKDIVNAKIASRVTTILKEFKKSDLEKMIVDDGGVRCRLPVETRWCSYRDAFKCLTKNLDCMKNVAAKTNRLKQEVVHDIFHADLIVEVNAFIASSDPVCTLINKCQSRNFSAADAVEEWANLSLPSEFEEKLSARKDMALNKYTMAANFLHPVYHGKKLTAFQKHRVQDFFLVELESDGLYSLQEFEMCEGIFATLDVKGIVNERTFWRVAQRYHDNLAKIALKLLKIPASSAQLERLFSNWSHIHTLLSPPGG